MSMIRILVLACALSGFEPAQAADYPAPVEGDFVLRDFHFSGGETLAELKIDHRAPRTVSASWPMPEINPRPWHR